jgi:hypothetical protein
VAPGGGADNVWLGEGGSDALILQTTQTLNGTDLIRGFDWSAGSGKDSISFDFGDGGLASKSALRGDGDDYQFAANSTTTIGADTGLLVIGKTNISNSAQLTTFLNNNVEVTGLADSEQLYVLTTSNPTATTADFKLFAVTVNTVGSSLIIEELATFSDNNILLSNIEYVL